MSLKISISGVRGSVPDSLTPEVCLDFAKAFGTYADGGKIVIGTDPRASSEYIKGIVFSGLLSTGCEVIDLGIVPTPTVGIMVRELKAGGGIVVTASHNPLPWNGIKFMRSDGIFLNESQAKRLIKIYETKAFIKAGGGSVAADLSANDIHIKKILKRIKPPRKKFKVVLDACNGAGSVIGVKLLEKLGCRVEAINCDISSPFPHAPEPIAENLNELMRAVRSQKADIGFAFDSDADRLAIVSDEGKAIGEEMSLVLAAKYVLSGSAGKKIAVTNLSTTRAMEDVAEKVVRTRIGEVHVAERIKKLKAVIGGEGNGGIIYPAIGFNRDALAGIALILNFMASTGKSISELVSEIPRYYVKKEKVECRNPAEAAAFIEGVKVQFRKERIDLTEGVKVILPSGWIHVRASNTEPIIRVIAEAKSEKEVDRLIGQVLKTVA